MVRKLLKLILNITFFIFFVSLITLNQCSPKVKIQKRTRFLMDTYCTIQVPGESRVVKIIDKALDRMEEIDNKFNSLESSNALYRFNQYSEPIKDEEIIQLLKIALDVNRDTKGAFDITVYPLIKLWGFFDNKLHIPDQNEIQDCLQNVGAKYLNLKNETLFKHNKNTKIDLGGIAKGYAIQEALDVIKSSGIENALIDAGGDIYALGTLNGKPWNIGIRNPRGEGVIGVLEISDKAVVTSGDYERFFEVDSVRYHHLLDPKTGYPTRGLASVTVISSDPVLADAWSTALFVMGKEEGLKLAEKKSDLDCIMITSDGEIFSTSDLK